MGQNSFLFLKFVFTKFYDGSTMLIKSVASLKFDYFLMIAYIVVLIMHRIQVNWKNFHYFLLKNRLSFIIFTCKT